MLKFSLTLIVSVITLWFSVGCSNQTPVSVAENSNAPVQNALVGDKQLRDISGDGANIWGVSFVDSTTIGDCDLYFFQPNIATWVKSSYAGKRIAISDNGKCYGYNKGSNKIFYCRMKLVNYNYQESGANICDAPWGRIVKDIGAGYISSTTDAIWVLCEDGAVCKGYVVNGVFQGWSMQWVSTMYTNINAISADPVHGENACIGTNIGIVIFDNGVFPTILNTSGSVNDVGLYNTTFFYLQAGCLYKQELGRSKNQQL
jgi:hypothetical protein